jgi:uncharacterized membrane protein
MNLVQYFLAFMFYSLIGWAYESLLYTVQEKKVISSGFLYGPYCPIYGGGAVIMVFVFYGRTDSSFVMFFGGMILATLVEYFTAVFLENCFHKKWWDYSKLKYNFQGRICLLGAVAFGTMCLFLCKIVQPWFVGAIALIPENVQFWLAVALAVIFLADYMVTLFVLRKKKKTALENDEVYENKLPQLNLEMIFDSVHLKKKFKFSLRDKIHFGGVSYIVEKLKLKPFYIEKVEKRIEPIKEKLSELKENK